MYEREIHILSVWKEQFSVCKKCVSDECIEHFWISSNEHFHLLKKIKKGTLRLGSYTMWLVLRLHRFCSLAVVCAIAMKMV